MTKTKDPGLGSNYDEKIDRIMNEDGSYNIRRLGGLTGVRDIYKFMIDLNWIQFVLMAFAAYLIINLIFALLYLMIGIEQLSGLDPNHSDFLNAFFFSVQTLTTIGYGHIAPSGLEANLVAVVESFVGLMIIALITGLLYGRFSKPSSKIAFSQNVIITDHNGGKAVMFKMVNQRNSTLLKASVKVLMTMDSENSTNGIIKEYHRLPLQIDHIDFFPLTWTIVHDINSKSPLYNMSMDEIRKRNCELITLVEAFDETHHQNVFERRSYAGDQWLENVRFVRNFRPNSRGQMELYIREIDRVEPIETTIS